MWANDVLKNHVQHQNYISHRSFRVGMWYFCTAEVQQVAPERACAITHLFVESLLCYIKLRYAMLCHVMLCYVILCYVMLCYVMLCYVMLCYDMLCYDMLCYVMLCYVMLCYVMLCYVMLCIHTLHWKNRKNIYCEMIKMILIKLPCILKTSHARNTHQLIKIRYKKYVNMPQDIFMSSSILIFHIGGKMMFLYFVFSDWDSWYIEHCIANL